MVFQLDHGRINNGLFFPPIISVFQHRSLFAAPSCQYVFAMFCRRTLVTQKKDPSKVGLICRSAQVHSRLSLQIDTSKMIILSGENIVFNCRMHLMKWTVSLNSWVWATGYTIRTNLVFILNSIGWNRWLECVEYTIRNNWSPFYFCYWLIYLCTFVIAIVVFIMVHILKQITWHKYDKKCMKLEFDFTFVFCFW